MAAAVRDLDPKDFDPDGDLLALVQGLQMTALVGMHPRRAGRPGRPHQGAHGDRR